MKLIVLSDIHLKVPEEAADHAVNHARLDAAIDRINQSYADADLVVIAGDLTDRGRYAASYEDLKKALSRLKPPHALTVGNHDHREVFLDVFGADQADADGFIQSAHIVDGHHVIVLDSLEKNTDPDVPYYAARTGHICEKRMTWLRDRLKDAKDAPAIVVLHHHAVPVSIQMDPWGLRDTKPLIDALVGHGGVRMVLSGHIHMTTLAMHRGIAFATLAGGHTNSVEDFGSRDNKFRRTGPAQMAVVLSDADATIVHFDNYIDDHQRITPK